MMINPCHGHKDGGAEKGKGAGCIAKPFVESRLRATLDGMLGRKKLTKEPAGG